MSITIGIDRDKRVRPEDQAQLDRYFPRSECLSWLLLDYMACDHGDPVERFVIYQMVPESKILPPMLEALKGPHPDTLWEWRTHPITKQVVRHSTAPMGLTAKNWELYQQYRAQARLFWIIQGSGGGHRYRVNDPIERKVRRMVGLPPDTPYPGELPFAEFDWRVLDNLLDLDDVRKYTRVADLLNRKAEDLDADERDAGEAARTALLRWWGKQVDHMVDEAGMVGRGGWWARNREHFPEAREGFMSDSEIQEQQFVTDAPYVGA